MKMLHSHGLQLTIDRFNAPSVMPQVVVISPRVRGHIATADSNKAYLSSRENGVSIRVRNVAFVAKDSGAIWQADGQFMNGGQILFRSRQQVKTDRNTVERTNQVQAPAKELFLLGGTITTECFAAHLLAARGPRSLAHWQGHTIDNERLALCEQVSQKVDDAVQPVSQRVQASVEPRHTQTMHIPQARHHTQRTLMMVLKILRCYHAHCQYLRPSAAGSTIVLKAVCFQNIINHYIRRYNIRVVHVAHSFNGCVVTPILRALHGRLQLAITVILITCIWCQSVLTSVSGVISAMERQPASPIVKSKSALKLRITSRTPLSPASANPYT